MASGENRHYANGIGALSFPIHEDQQNTCSCAIQYQRKCYETSQTTNNLRSRDSHFFTNGIINMWY